MDTEAFLLRRQELQATMEGTRAAIGDRADYQGPTLLSIPLMSWVRLFMGPSPESWILKSLQKLALVAVVPAVMGLFKKWQVHPLIRGGVAGLLSRINL